MDPFVDAKTFVLQYPYGTGSHIKSPLWDTIEDIAIYRQQCFWSLDGVFTDDFQWAFFQHEMDLKRKLYNDWHGKHKTQEDFKLPESATMQSDKIKKEKNYSRQMYSQRVGRLVPGSTQHLLAERHNLIHFARPENAGAPTAMTTVVTNA